jgi:hypothetical protein
LPPQPFLFCHHNHFCFAISTNFVLPSQPILFCHLNHFGFAICNLFNTDLISANVDNTLR